MNERPNHVENLDPDAGESPEDPTPSPTLPDLDGVPEDDSAEPEDAEVEHLASEEEVLSEGDEE